jgi:hypothetical protein
MQQPAGMLSGEFPGLDSRQKSWTALADAKTDEPQVTAMLW